MAAAQPGAERLGAPRASPARRERRSTSSSSDGALGPSRPPGARRPHAARSCSSSWSAGSRLPCAGSSVSLAGSPVSSTSAYSSATRQPSSNAAASGGSGAVHVRTERRARRLIHGAQGGGRSRARCSSSAASAAAPAIADGAHSTCQPSPSASATACDGVAPRLDARGRLAALDGQRERVRDGVDQRAVAVRVELGQPRAVHGARAERERDAQLGLAPVVEREQLAEQRADVDAAGRVVRGDRAGAVR